MVETESVPSHRGNPLTFDRISAAGIAKGRAVVVAIDLGVQR
jgi:hypothetical protein